MGWWNELEYKAREKGIKQGRKDAKAEIDRLTRENATIASDVAALLKDNTALEDKVEALTRERDEARAVHEVDQKAFLAAISRAESAEAELARLREQMKDR